MDEPDWEGALGEAFEHAVAHLGGLPDRPVGSRAGLAQLRAALSGPLPEGPRDPREVITELAAAVDRRLGPRGRPARPAPRRARPCPRAHAG